MWKYHSIPANEGSKVFHFGETVEISAFIKGPKIAKLVSLVYPQFMSLVTEKCIQEDDNGSPIFHAFVRYGVLCKHRMAQP